MKYFTLLAAIFAVAAVKAEKQEATAEQATASAESAASSQVAQDIQAMAEWGWGVGVCCNPYEPCYNPCACPAGEVLVGTLKYISGLRTIETEAEEEWDQYDPIIGSGKFVQSWKCVKLSPDCNVNCGKSKYNGFCGFCQSRCERFLTQCRFPTDILVSTFALFNGLETGRYVDYSNQAWTQALEGNWLSFGRDGFSQITHLPSVDGCREVCGCDAFPVCLTRTTLNQLLLLGNNERSPRSPCTYNNINNNFGGCDTGCRVN